jgi:hypothetical protein
MIRNKKMDDKLWNSLGEHGDQKLVKYKNSLHELGMTENFTCDLGKKKKTGKLTCEESASNKK